MIRPCRIILALSTRNGGLSVPNMALTLGLSGFEKVEEGWGQGEEL